LYSSRPANQRACAVLDLRKCVDHELAVIEKERYLREGLFLRKSGDDY
jgi:hypothetical protein